MSWLFLAIILDCVFAQAFKYGQRHGHSFAVLVSVSYFFLGLTLLAFLLISGAPFPPVPVLLYGAGMGLVFYPAMMSFNYALHHAPAGSVLTAFRLSIVVPVMLGVWIWGESLSMTQTAGIILALASLALMTRGQRGPGTLTRWRMLLLLAVVFGMQGASFSLLRSVNYAGFGDYTVTVVMAIGFSAGTLGLVVLLLRRMPLQFKATLLGGGIGIYNSLALSVVLVALNHLPGTVYFPLAACGIVILDNLLAHYFWKERLSPRNIVGVIIAISALGLVVF